MNIYIGINRWLAQPGCVIARVRCSWGAPGQMDGRTMMRLEWPQEEGERDADQTLEYALRLMLQHLERSRARPQALASGAE